MRKLPAPCVPGAPWAESEGKAFVRQCSPSWLFLRVLRVLRGSVFLLSWSL